VSAGAERGIGNRVQSVGLRGVEANGRTASRPEELAIGHEGPARFVIRGLRHWMWRAGLHGLGEVTSVHLQTDPRAGDTGEPQAEEDLMISS